MPALTAVKDKEDKDAVRAGGGFGSFQFDGYSRKDELVGIVL